MPSLYFFTGLISNAVPSLQSPFSKDCPQRPYECLISTLKKFPWYATDRITISQRHAAFAATCELLRLLERSIEKQDDPINLNTQLLRRLATAGMKCPGFTPLMKDDIAYLAGLCDVEEGAYNQPHFACSWRHQYSMSPKPGVPCDVLEVFANLEEYLSSISTLRGLT